WYRSHTRPVSTTSRDTSFLRRSCGVGTPLRLSNSISASLASAALDGYGIRSDEGSVYVRLSGGTDRARRRTHYDSCASHRSMELRTGSPCSNCCVTKERRSHIKT